MKKWLQLYCSKSWHSNAAICLGFAPSMQIHAVAMCTDYVGYFGTVLQSCEHSIDINCFLVDTTDLSDKSLLLLRAMAFIWSYCFLIVIRVCSSSSPVSFPRHVSLSVSTNYLQCKPCQYERSEELHNKTHFPEQESLKIGGGWGWSSGSQTQLSSRTLDFMSNELNQSAHF